MLEEPAADLELAAALRAALTQVYLRVGSKVPGLGLTVPQTTVLLHLLQHGPLRMGELADLGNVKLPTVTSIADRLAQLGLVQRQADPADRRAVLAALTTKGRDTVSQIARARDTHLAGLVHQLDATDKDALRAALPALRRLLALDPKEPQA